LTRERSREFHQPKLLRRQFRRNLAGDARQADAGNRGTREFSRFLISLGMDECADDDILRDRQTHEWPHDLKRPPRAGGAHFVGLAPDEIDAIQENFAAIRSQESVEKIEYGRLAGPVGTDNPEDRSFHHVETDILNSLQSAETARQIFDAEQNLLAAGSARHKRRRPRNGCRLHNH
jgi:hypothetical protein